MRFRQFRFVEYTDSTTEFDKFKIGNSYLDSIDLWLLRAFVDFNPGISQQAKAPPTFLENRTS